MSVSVRVNVPCAPASKSNVSLPLSAFNSTVPASESKTNKSSPASVVMFSKLMSVSVPMSVPVTEAVLVPVNRTVIGSLVAA